MGKILLGLLLSLSLLKAETNTVDTSSFDMGITFPINFSYVTSQSYIIDSGIDAYIEYDMFALHINGGYGYHFVKDKEIEDMHEATYGLSLLYAFNNRIELGPYYSKYVSVKTSETNDKFDGGEMSSYGLKILYNPNYSNSLVEEGRKKPKKRKLNYIFSVGYLDADKMLSINRKSSIESKTVDLSGTMITLGLLLRF